MDQDRVLNCGRITATRRARRAWTWQHALPATFAALAAGAIDEPRAAALAEAVAHVAPGLARQVEARLLPSATGLSVGRLRARAVALLVELDAAGTDTRRRRAERDADVRVYPAPPEGMSTLAAELPTADAAACREVVDRLAALLKADGDPRRDRAAARARAGRADPAAVGCHPAGGHRAADRARLARVPGRPG